MKSLMGIASSLLLLLPLPFVLDRIQAPDRSEKPLPAQGSEMTDWAMTSISWSDIPHPEDNPLTRATVELGAMLFFDPRLSGSNGMSCATCHHPKMGFSDGIPLFIGDHGETGPRATPTAQNLAWNTTFFWDGRAGSLEEQALMPISSMDEMRQDAASMIDELRRAGYYAYFKKAFGKGAVLTEENVGKALANFQRTLVSVNSPFDRYMKGDRTAMTPSQIRGMNVFETRGQCTTCHFGPNFTDDGFHNIGIDTQDEGRYKLVPLPSMKYAFKTPGLRDVAFRAPYFHNGSAATLEEVIELYDQGGVPRMRELPNIAIQPLFLTARDKADLVAFLEALTGEGVYDYPVPRLP